MSYSSLWASARARASALGDCEPILYSEVAEGRSVVLRERERGLYPGSGGIGGTGTLETAERGLLLPTEERVL